MGAREEFIAELEFLGDEEVICNVDALTILDMLPETWAVRSDGRYSYMCQSRACDVALLLQHPRVVSAAYCPAKFEGDEGLMLQHARVFRE
jgi:hypothetical protein